MSVLGLKKAIGNALNFIVSTVPGASATVQKQIDGEVNNAIKDMIKNKSEEGTEIYGPKINCASGFSARMAIPANGVPKDELYEELQAIAKGDVKKVVKKEFPNWFQQDTVFAYTYDTTTGEHEEFTTKAHNLFIGANGLNPMAFPSARKFEVEIVEMTRKMLNGPDTCVGALLFT